jgi:hypothetical protein
MGKKLVIKGADFSNNAVPIVIIDVTTEYTIADLPNSEYGIKATTGVLTPFENWKASDFVELSESNTIVLTTSTTAGTFGLAFYSANNESSYISGVISASHVDAELTIPTNTKYVRFSTNITDSIFSVKITRQIEQ